MPKVTNTSAYLIHVGNFMLVPGLATEVPEDLLQVEGLKALMEAGTVKPGEVEVKPEVQQDGPEPEALKETSTTKPATQRSK